MNVNLLYVAFLSENKYSLFCLLPLDILVSLLCNIDLKTKKNGNLVCKFWKCIIFPKFNFSYSKYNINVSILKNIVPCFRIMNNNSKELSIKNIHINDLYTIISYQFGPDFLQYKFLVIFDNNDSNMKTLIIDKHIFNKFCFDQIDHINDIIFTKSYDLFNLISFAFQKFIYFNNYIYFYTNKITNNYIYVFDIKNKEIIQSIHICFGKILDIIIKNNILYLIKSNMFVLIYLKNNKIIQPNFKKKKNIKIIKFINNANIFKINNKLFSNEFIDINNNLIYILDNKSNKFKYSDLDKIYFKFFDLKMISNDKPKSFSIKNKEIFLNYVNTLRILNLKFELISKFDFLDIKISTHYLNPNFGLFIDKYSNNIYIFDKFLNIQYKIKITDNYIM